MPPVGFEPTISAGEWPQTYALDRAATGTHVSQVVISVSDESPCLVCLSALKREAVASFGTLIRVYRKRRNSILNLHCHENRNSRTAYPHLFTVM